MSILKDFKDRSVKSAAAKNSPVKRNSDCPALGICNGLGAASDRCRAGAPAETKYPHNCSASIVLLLAELIKKSGSN